MSWLTPLVIRASAGTGKTFQLTNRYLQLLAAGEAPDKILATTFTRKAAGEIRERVYTRVANAALDLQAAQNLSREIGYDTNAATQWQEVLLRLVATQDRLGICTLDSFCMRLAKSFAYELGLAFSWRMSDEAENRQLELAAVGEVIARESHDELLDLVLLFRGGRLVTAVIDTLLREVRELSEISRETVDNAWEWFAVPKPRGLKPVAELRDELSKLALPTNKDGTPLKLWEQARARDVSLIENPELATWNEFLAQGIAGSLVQGKAEFSRREVPPAIRSVYEQLIAHARLAILSTLQGATVATRRVLELYRQRAEDLRRELGHFSFSDIKELLRNAALNDLGSMYFRLDTKLQHILLDEFQDTSLAEWRVLEPVVDEILAQAGESRSFFCVGDVKQAIYGWRGGVAKIFDRLRERYPILEEYRLATSYRSAPEIISLVNQVFTTLRDNAALSAYREPAEKWLRGFETHSTERNKLSGYVELTEVSEETNCYARAVDTVEQLLRQSENKSIAILVRRNSTVNELILALRDKGILASQEGGNPLIDSVAVTWILALLTAADHPGDTVAWFHVANSPLAPLVELKSTPNPKARNQLSRALRTELVGDGLGNVVSRLCDLLSAHMSGNEKIRLDQLAELAYVYEARASLRFDDFVHYVQHTPVESATPVRVRVMTIHRAKGLEFDAVILPELAATFDKVQPPKILFERSDQTGEIARVIRYPNKTTCALDPQLKHFSEAYRAQQAEDELNVFYVALTRARQALYMIVPPLSERQGEKLPRSFAGILRGALCSESSPTAGTLFAKGDSNWWRHHV